MSDDDLLDLGGAVQDDDDADPSVLGIGEDPSEEDEKKKKTLEELEEEEEGDETEDDYFNAMFDEGSGDYDND